MSYNQPILLEIYLKVTLREGALPESKYFSIVPLLQTAGLITVELGQALEQHDQVARQVSRVKCWDKDKFRLVQLAPDVVLVNQTKQYLGWSKFRELIGVTFAAVADGGVPLNFKSIELNTIDQFEVPLPDYRFGKWLNCKGPYLPPWYEDVSDPCDIHMGQGLLNVNGQNRQLHVHVETHPKAGIARIRMQGIFHDALQDQKSFDERLSALHDEANEQFESIITDALRTEIMRGRKH